MRRLSPLGFYSKAAEKAQELPEGLFPAQQLIASLVNKGGISKDELVNAGIHDEDGKIHPDWAKRGKISKQDLIEHLHDSLPQITEVSRHRDPTREIQELEKSTAAIDRTLNQYDAGSPEREYRENVLAERRQRLEELYDIRDNRASDKFGDLTLPYQKNYREVLLQLNTPRQWQNGNPVTKEDLATEQGRRDADRSAAFVNTPFKSTHWDTPNVLAHIRMSDRVGPRDEKILHIEELQSDWGQKARKQGTVKANEKKLIQLDAAKHSHPVGSPEREEADRNLQTFIDENFPGAPEGPYVTSTAAWTDLALKRVLHEAAKGGYDQIVWTPGQQHANRYKLRNYVNRVAYDPEEKELSYVRKNGDDWESHDGPVEPHELGKIIGEDAAQKLLSTPPNKLSGIHNLETPDLEFGGEGMKGYYDKIVPTRLQKLAQSHDPQAKVGLSNVKLPPDTERDDPDEPIRPLGLTITPQMRQSILQGQSAFRDGGAVDDEDEDGITAYHGSPHEFEQFDTSKIGTGEGAQAYGHGLYFAQSEPVAKGYRDKLSVQADPRDAINDVVHQFKVGRVSAPTRENIKKWMSDNTALKNYVNNDDIISRVHEVINADNDDDAFHSYRELDNLLPPPSKGHMYGVHIKAHPDHFIDWDAPLSEQHPDVWQKLVRGPSFIKDAVKNGILNNKTYGDIHGTIVAKHPRGQQGVSEHMAEMGIPGIKYLDAGSRGQTDKPTRNYVVFDHNNVAVKRKYARGGVVG